MGLLNNPNFDPKNLSGGDGANLFVTDENGQKFRVVDGDTIERIGEDGTAQSYRIQNLAAQERERDKGGEFYQGEVRGDYDKRALWEVLNNEGFSINDLGIQDTGQGAGRRRLAQLTTTDGVDVSNRMFELGLFDANRYTTDEQLNATKRGELQRELFGQDDGYQNVRGDAPIIGSNRVNPFKQRALADGKWYNPDYHFGVHFDKKGQDRYGYTTNPLSTAWYVGKQSAIGDYGGFLESLGHVSPFYSDWLQETGKEIQGKAQQKLTGAGIQRVGTWSNVQAESDGFWDYLANGIEYIGVNTVQSAPYLGAVAAGAAATTVAVTAGAPVTLAAAASTAPLAALHAGNVWNQIDRYEYNEDGSLKRDAEGNLVTNKNAVSAGKAMTAGVAMATLDRLGLRGAIGAQEILTKAGRDKAIDLIKNKTLRETGQRLSDKDALRVFNNSARESTIELIDHMGRKQVDDQLIQRGLLNVLGGVALQSGKGAASESLTEASQELTAHLVAAQVNEEITSIDELVNYLEENWEGEGDIRTLLKESAIGGAAVGGAINIGSNLINAAKNEKFYRDYIADGDPKTRREIENIYVKYESEDGTISDQIDRVKEEKRTKIKDGSYTEGFFDDSAESGKQDSYWKQKFFKGKSSTSLTPLDAVPTDLFAQHTNADANGNYSWEQLSITPAAVLDVVTHYGGRLVNAPMFNHFKADVLESTKAGRSIVSRLSKARGAGNAGRTAEQQIDWVKSTLNGFVGEKWFNDNWGMNNTNKSKNAMSNILRAYGKNLHNKVRTSGIDSITDQDIDALNKNLEGRVERKITRDDLPKLLESAQKFEVYQQEAFDIQLDALTREYGVDSDVVKDFEKTFDPDWWWSHRLPDKAKVSKNRSKFIKFIEALRQDALKNNKSLDEKQKAILKDKDYAEKAYNSIIRGRDMEEFSLVGGIKWGKDGNKRMLDWGKKDVIIDGEKVSMDDFQMDNMFGTMQQNSRSLAQRSTIMNYFGDGGSDLDVLFSDMRKELIESGRSPEEVDRLVKNTAKDTKNIIDSITGNYNRIQNPRLERIQSAILQWTTISGLLLAGLSSFPEFGTVMVDVGGQAEVRGALNKTMRTSFIRTSTTYVQY